ncbi:hypothetical protein [uncultured Imperialibacter sp.]|uniref:hypothetical protein n=1 Tax=uncultured Imperialibacter sp. TaxID=1672639 RepID=UPI0030D8BEF7|tara:strand:- start:82 stop:690 length:609 start_codon:yes stop_codon:yes gene_type:complete
MDIRNAKLHPDQYFHIFNRGINGMPVFFEPKNYDFFLKQYTQFVHPFVETFAYCLLGNHFHLLIRVRDIAQLDLAIKKDREKPYYWHVSNGFSSFLKSYTRAVNSVYNRTGGLFETPFKRIEVKEESYFSALIAYIHRNPEKHGLVKDFRSYPYSSYQAHLQDAPTFLSRQAVLDWFGGKEQYQAFHLQEKQPPLDEKWLLE